MKSTYRIYGGDIVIPTGVVKKGTVTIRDGSIVDIQPHVPVKPSSNDICADGMWVLPGLIDTHSDAIEMEIQPRPNTFFNIDLAVRQLEKKLAGQGITTMYHALAVTDNPSMKQVRRKETIEAILQSLDGLSHDQCAIRHRIHLRFEMTCIDMIDFVENLLMNGKVHQFSFMDHTPGQGQHQDMGLYKNYIMGGSKSEAEAARWIQEKQNRAKAELRRLQRMADIAYEKGIAIASHDDDSIEKLDIVAELHAAISEFPITLAVAKEAKGRGLFVVMGAPNLLLGGSHSNNLSALEALQAGAVDILCSDYYPSALLHSVFQLEKHGFDLPYAINLVSLNPAKALGIGERTGSLEVGKMADLLLVRHRNGVPLVERTIVGGSSVYQMNYSSPLKIGL